MASKRYAMVDSSVCVACGACENVCPREAVAVKNGCFARVEENACIGCGKCAGICPAGCIKIKERGGQV